MAISYNFYLNPPNSAPEVPLQPDDFMVPAPPPPGDIEVIFLDVDQEDMNQAAAAGGDQAAGAGPEHEGPEQEDPQPDEDAGADDTDSSDGDEDVDGEDVDGEGPDDPIIATWVRKRNAMPWRS